MEAKKADDAYSLWNLILADYCLLSDSSDGFVTLTITPGQLAAARTHAGMPLLTPEEAQKDFADAVAAVYKRRVLDSGKGLRGLQFGAPNDVPAALGFLALSVLSAYDMHQDEERTARAFYPRFAENLQCELVGDVPVGFEKGVFAALWKELDDWLAAKYGRHLAMPDPNSVRKYYEHPMAHVPLRKLDIERLPAFFESCGYEPGAQAPISQLEFDLFSESGAWRGFSKSGRKALADDKRRPLVVRQVAQELEQWDGSLADTSGNRTAAIELRLATNRRRFEIHLVARRPDGFPRELSGDDLVFSSNQDGWYDAIPLRNGDSRILDAGLRFSDRNSQGRFRLQLRHGRAIPLTPSAESAGLWSDRVLRADVDCAVLAKLEDVPQILSYLSEVGCTGLEPRSDETLPNGWCVIPGVKAVRSGNPPVGMDRLRVESSLALFPDGGLKLGGRWRWLESAPARLKILGQRSNIEIRIDAQEVALDEDGWVPSDRFSTIGPHIIEAGVQLRRKVEILEGVVNPSCQSWPSDAEIGVGPMAVPPGYWALVGSQPGEVLISSSNISHWERPAFKVSWFLGLDGRKPGPVLHYHDARPNLPTKNPQDGRTSQHIAWADAIYRSGIGCRHPQCQHGCSSDSLSIEWRRINEVVRRYRRKGRR